MVRVVFVFGGEGWNARTTIQGAMITEAKRYLGLEGFIVIALSAMGTMPTWVEAELPDQEQVLQVVMHESSLRGEALGLFDGYVPNDHQLTIVCPVDKLEEVTRLAHELGPEDLQIETIAVTLNGRGTTTANVSFTVSRELAGAGERGPVVAPTAQVSGPPETPSAQPSPRARWGSVFANWIRRLMGARKGARA